MTVSKPSAAAVPPGTVAISIDDERFPPLLREIYDPPKLLYVRGDPAALGCPQLAIVGSRRASSAGLRLAKSLARQLAGQGVSVCSGLALGIDGAAHKGALEAGGTSVAVMATGIDTIYPVRHAALAESLQASGCLVTEMRPGTPPRPGLFPRRNRLISGMSLGVLVIEAALPSGSLLTAQAALEQGRDVFALPWSPLHEGGRGCLQLLRDGAKMVLEVEDILEELPLPQTFQPHVAPDGETGDAGMAADLLQYIGFEMVALDSLLATSGRPVEVLQSQLTALELEGQIERTVGGFIRT